jgi:Holliday junction DNA helicase RuvA
MIGYLSGTIISTSDKALTLLVGGVGYKVFVTEETLKLYGEPDTLELFTYLSVRENALDLFGFASKEELSFFELLITVSGIGPRSALAVLSAVAVPTLRQAITTGDAGYLTKVSGIGKKTAEKIVLELREKVSSIEEGVGRALKEESDALLALMSLGYNERDIRETLKHIDTTTTDTEAIIREALKQLGRG